MCWQMSSANFTESGRSLSAEAFDDHGHGVAAGRALTRSQEVAAMSDTSYARAFGWRVACACA